MDDVTKTAPKAARKAANPVVTEIVRNGLVAVTEEMKINLMRTAYNMIIYEALDFTVGLFDARGNIVSIGLGLPMFIRGMSETVKAKIEHYGVENIEPGDVLLTNDAYITGSHLNHMTFTVPIFHDGELVGFSCCMAHWPDVGGTIMEGTTDIFSEGLQMPIVKIYRKGEPNEELIDLIKMNVRLPERAMGDFRAQLAAVKTGERRFAEMVRKYGRDDVLNGIEAIMDQSEAVARARVANMPDGVYEAESLHGRRRHQCRPARADQGAGRDRGRQDDGRPLRRVAAGAGLLQLRQDRGLFLRPGGVQVPDLVARPADQRGPVPRARHRAAAGPRGERDEARGDAHVDDLSDDHRRHDLQGAGAGAARPGDRRPPCRPRASAASTAGGRRTTASTSISAG